MKEEKRQINYLIDLIKNSVSFYPEQDLSIYEELLQLSIKWNDLYGQAFAYIKFASAYKRLQQQNQYTESIQKAYEIAYPENFLDILVRYYNEEGIRYMENYDEATALSMYLKGINLAIKMADNNLCAIIYNNIAEIFSGSRDHDKAIVYYLKALDVLDLVNDENSKKYRQLILENIIRSFYHKNDLEHTKQYFDLYKKTKCEDVKSFETEVEIRMLMLEKQYEEALIHAMGLYNELMNTKTEDPLFYSYSFLCHVFIECGKQKEAWFCLTQLDLMKMQLSQNYVMEKQKLKIRYQQTFKVDDIAVYQAFYDETLRYELINKQAIANSLGAAVSLYEIQKQKRQMKKERQNLEEIVKYDPLTNIYNRRSHNQLVEECMHNTAISELAYIMIDIDYFKEYNDYYGHDAGDVILKKVSSLIQTVLPENAYLGRFGGDEFVCLLVNQSMREVDRVMRNIQLKIAKQEVEHLGIQGANLTLSLGAYYSCKNKALDLDILIKKADEALYEVKNRGRNGYKIIHET